MGKNHIVKDFSYSFLSIGISIGILQLIIYPNLSRYLSIEEYGYLVAIVGVLTAIYQTFGGALSQTRLIRNKFYDKENGDFSFLIFVCCIFVAIMSIILSIRVWKASFKDIFLYVILAISSTYNAYAIVIFRIQIDFKKFLISNIIVGIGYILGIVFTYFTDSWPLIFITAQIALFIYIFSASNIVKEPFSLTSHFKHTLSAFMWLLLSTGIANSVQYLDKFIIFPVLGAENASIFFASTYLAKSVSMIMLPLNNVLLSYISTGIINIDRKSYLFLSVATLLICAIAIILLIIIDFPLTKFFFPTLVEAAVPFFLVSHIGVLLGIAYGIIGIPMLVYAPTFWQLVLNTIQFIVYISFAIFLSQLMGLLGFCYSMLIANALRIVISIGVSYFYMKKPVNAQI